MCTFTFNAKIIAIFSQILSLRLYQSTNISFCWFCFFHGIISFSVRYVFFLDIFTFSPCHRTHAPLHSLVWTFFDPWNFHHKRSDGTRRTQFFIFCNLSCLEQKWILLLFAYVFLDPSRARRRVKFRHHRVSFLCLLVESFVFCDIMSQPTYYDDEIHRKPRHKRKKESDKECGANGIKFFFFAELCISFL